MASEQAQGWLKSLPPDSKRRVRLALRSLVHEGRVDVKVLEGELQGFYRLKVGGYRLVFSETAGEAIHLEYADLREFVYETFIRLLRERA